MVGTAPISAAAMTSRTPGIARAAARSRPRIRPCAIGLRRIAACSIPSLFRSPTNSPRPRRNRKSSIRYDSAAARAIPGVRDVIAAAEIGAVPTIPLRLLPLPGTERFLQPVIATGRLRYVGEPIAVVLADSAALAEDGVGAIILDVEELPPVADRRASGQHEILLFEESGTNL